MEKLSAACREKRGVCSAQVMSQVQGEARAKHSEYLKMSQFYKTKMYTLLLTPRSHALSLSCPWFGVGKCRMGDRCNWSHDATDIRPSVDLAKTKLCAEFMKGNVCSYKCCRYAHSYAELRATSDVYKTILCVYWTRGHCVAGLNCRYAHGQEELRQRAPPSEKLPAPVSLVPSVEAIGTMLCASPKAAANPSASRLTTTSTTVPSLASNTPFSLSPSGSFLPSPSFLKTLSSKRSSFPSSSSTASSRSALSPLYLPPSPPADHLPSSSSPPTPPLPILIPLCPLLPRPHPFSPLLLADDASPPPPSDGRRSDCSFSSDCFASEPSPCRAHQPSPCRAHQPSPGRAHQPICSAADLLTLADIARARIFSAAAAAGGAAAAVGGEGGCLLGGGGVFDGNEEGLGKMSRWSNGGGVNGRGGEVKTAEDKKGMGRFDLMSQMKEDADDYEGLWCSLEDYITSVVEELNATSLNTANTIL
eukprot:GHVS01088269.1.p1 GENE.GHVS01088269.1~~GHVS01088269.1.p1  ORF type:complete len:476 (+),score=96.43 GHVS01088269.1:299-1726(+)